MSSNETISVVVPTRNRPQALQRCLVALQSQTIEVEVIVSEDFDGTGPAAARNAGARRAGGTVVLFTDDDCEPEPDWAERLAAACPSGGAAAGETVNAAAGAFAATSQILTSELQRASRREDGSLGFAPTSNLAVGRTLLARVPFDESFPAAAGEDRDWCARVGAEGASLRYEPAAIVRHHQDLGLAGFWRQQLRYGRGAARYRSAGGRLAEPAVRGTLLRAAFRRGAGIGLLALLAQLAVATGFAGERLRAGAAAARPARPRRRP